MTEASETKKETQMVEEEKKGADDAPAGKEVGTMATGDYMIHVSVHWFVIVVLGVGLYHEWQELEVCRQVSAISSLFACSVAII